MSPSAITPVAAAAAASTKPLWAAVGVLGVAVLGMGGALIANKAPAPAATPAAVVATVAAPVAAPIAAPVAAPIAAPTPVLEQKPQSASVSRHIDAPKSVAKPVAAKVAPAPAPVPVAVAAPVPVVVAQAPAPSDTPPTVVGGGQSQPVVQAGPAPVAKPICAACGTVEAVTPVQRAGHASGVGAVAGGVLGAVVGNQVGNGNGKTLATILGGVAGGLAGNSVEKAVKKETVYSVRVKMEDGSARTLEQATAPALGAKVTVDGTSLRGPDGAVVSSAPKAPAPRAAQPATDPSRVGG